ncbi:TIGR00730 family Rossman fold protein [Marinobacter vulgaris]|uniref:Cytokinin riboside 5'-monophosphate phosphoribohydrolase n=1 Tax=Marinobacter vulgaris TaxID=1928331 RepID=A0A2V4A2B6_9GAMM|nr:TIGR00730 family Rossman fold protein [Marinobacter vulgaris]PXX92704.1 TIGR00730 family Rossman fold protein [Marinobacter vulgaris]TSJ71348.1 TIGR00730 family Rossman fold protein [Marinobacter vulgaris]
MKIAVFCGSSRGIDERFADAAEVFGQYMASQDIDLVFGGGKVGLMGVVADAVLAGGREVYGVIPESLRDRELAHQGLTRLDVVASMHERKALMADMADAFVALPGGPGTMDEIFEAWTWGQLGYHNKPCAFYNVNGYYDELLAFISKMSGAGFLKPEYADMLIVEQQPQALVSALKNYRPPACKWPV